MSVVLTWLMMGFSLFAQSWDGLQGLKPGERVRVLDQSGQQHGGAFKAMSATSITIETGKGEQAIERTQVRRVQIRSSARRARNFLIGVGVGVAVGVTIDQSLGTYFRNEAGQTAGARAVTYIAPIALFGALGSLPAYRTIYQVK